MPIRRIGPRIDRPFPIVIWQKGKLSQGAAAWLRHTSVPADALEDGFEAGVRPACRW